MSIWAHFVDCIIYRLIGLVFLRQEICQTMLGTLDDPYQSALPFQLQDIDNMGAGRLMYNYQRAFFSVD